MLFEHRIISEKYYILYIVNCLNEIYFSSDVFSYHYLEVSDEYVFIFHSFSCYLGIFHHEHCSQSCG